MNKIYDYIIVGGGSSGCVLANRLSSNPNHQVCLLEAGPTDTDPSIHVPMGILFAIRNKKLNWCFRTVPQKNCDNRAMLWPRGKTLGGCSSLNAMCYTRGNPHDYDQWASLGCTGWSFQDLFPYFIKIENFEPGENKDHGWGGPINIATYTYLNPLMAVFVKAGQQAGYSLVNDYNAASQEGVGYFYVTQKNGQRFSNADGYLHPIKHRSNLTVLTNAHVCKILFEEKRAVGIRYLKNDDYVEVFAQKEVILAAGAIGTPQILMLSGVGPKVEIEKHGIPLIHALPGVGENLQDHLDIHITCLDKTHTALSFKPSYLWRFLISIYEYVFHRRGELTSNYTQAVGFAKTNPQLPIADIQWHFAASMYTNSATELKPLFNHYGYTLMVCYLHPKSRGRITLRDANPLSPPLIDANYLAHESDLDAMVLAFKKSREILSQKAFQPYFQSEYEPGEAVQSDDEIKAYIRKRSETIYHPVGTCKMGIDAMSVVDPQTLKIYGLENIRIVDASLMPILVSGNTNAAVTAIAEKAADIILNEKTNTSPKA